MAYQHDWEMKGVYPVRCLVSTCHWFVDLVEIYLQHPLRLVCCLLCGLLTVLFIASLIYLIIALTSDQLRGNYSGGINSQRQQPTFLISEGMHDAFSGRIKTASRFKRAMNSPSFPKL